MNLELQKKLFEKYPEIFRQKDSSMRETCMCWGIDCDDGWYWLIDNLCNCIQRYINGNKKHQIEAVQVKEKFATLRFYTNYSDSIVEGMIWFAESLSGKICEVCGSTEDVSQTEGWITTLCRGCMKVEEEGKR